MTEPAELPVDHPQRLQALDVTASFIVQAPAGSGKTELLIQRILALLGSAATPEEILAITFTRKAAAEMHQRLLEALEQAAKDSSPEPAHALKTWTLACAALDRDRERGWNLLDCPARLQVMTIDSFCAALVRHMPYLARFGEPPAIIEDPADLYNDAAERLLARLERGTNGAASIERLLTHLDNQLPLLRDLLTAMLGRRDQWLRHLDPDLPATARPDLEGALRLHVTAALAALQATLDGKLSRELTAVGAWAAGNLAAAGGDDRLSALAGRTEPPMAVAEALPAWLALCHLVLTKDGEVRTNVDARLGFPPDKDPLCREMKERARAALAGLRDNATAVERFRELRLLPAAAYTEAQWEVLSALVELLPLAERELREVFRTRGKVDFAEISRGALDALGDDLAPAELLLHLDSRLRHILVDEFQDTSRGQYDLLARLMSGWEEGDGRTLFVVGDPMQSIYRFREAEVGLYLRVRARGLETVRLSPLVLQANFRSRAGLVDWFNTVFARLFPMVEDEMRGAVPYSPAVAAHAADAATPVTVTCFEGRDDAAEAARVIALIEQSRREQPEGTTAVLVRSRAHLAALIPALKTAGIPWQAQEIDPLGSRPAIRDLLALTRALLHPADRIAWLSILRAPWCGLRLDDLLALCGDDGDATVWECLHRQEVQPPLFRRLSDDAQARLEPVVAVLAKGLAGKGRMPLRRLVESVWLGLHGPAGLTLGDLSDAEQFFLLLEELDEGGDLVRLEALEERLGKLHAAPDPQADAGLQLMTIHKAKGLEFDTVILPGLGRSVRGAQRSLLLWQERPAAGFRQEGLLLAPIPASAADDDEPTYRAIARIHAEKDRLETLRLFYVAVTRARRRLHLLGHAGRDQGGNLVPASGSLLRAAWPVLGAAALAGAVAPAAADPPVAAAVGVPLRRLPLAWLAPAPAPPLAVAGAEVRRASDHAHRPPMTSGLTLRTEEGRVVGTAVHGWLERFARDGVDCWPERRLADIRPRIRASLLAGGVPRSRVDACAGLAMQALTNTLRSSRGRWILEGHRDNACELAITGVLDGAAVHAVIDRTFIDNEGIRWVVDYKTSSRGEGETLSELFEREREHYRVQLDAYRRLLGMMHPAVRVKAALYFPLEDGWCEVD